VIHTPAFGSYSARIGGGSGGSFTNCTIIIVTMISVTVTAAIVTTVSRGTSSLGTFTA